MSTILGDLFGYLILTLGFGVSNAGLDSLSQVLPVFGVEKRALVAAAAGWARGGHLIQACSTRLHTDPFQVIFN